MLQMCFSFTSSSEHYEQYEKGFLSHRFMPSVMMWQKNFATTTIIVEMKAQNPVSRQLLFILVNLKCFCFFNLSRLAQFYSTKNTESSNAKKQLKVLFQERANKVS
jgi:hypothetical protein